MRPTAPHGSLSARARALALILFAIIAAGSSLAQEVTPLEAARALITEKQYEAAIEAVAPALESPDPTTVREAKLVVADCQRLLTRHDEAIASYTALVDEGTQDQTLVTALTGLADCLIRTGKLDEADAAIERALALYPEITDAAYAARGSSFYSRNVVQYYSAVEFARGQLTRLASGYASAGNPAAALLTWRRLYHEYADHRNAPDIAIKVGDLLNSGDTILNSALDTPRCSAQDGVRGRPGPDPGGDRGKWVWCPPNSSPEFAGSLRHHLCPVGGQRLRIPQRPVVVRTDLGDHARRIQSRGTAAGQ